MKNKYINIKLNILLILVIIITLYISTLLDINTNNFSDLITIFNPIIYIWSLICSIYTTLIISIIKKYNNKKSLYLFIYLNMIIFIPYNPNDFLLFSQLHIILAFIGFIYLIYILIYELYYYNLYKCRYYKLINYIFIVMSLSLIYIYLDNIMINTLFQLIFIILISIMFRIIIKYKDY